MHFPTRWITDAQFQCKTWSKFNSRKFWIYSNAKTIPEAPETSEQDFFFFFLIHCYLICSSNPTCTEAFVFEKISSLLVRKKLEFSLRLYWNIIFFFFFFKRIYLLFLTLVYNSLRSSQKERVTTAEVNPLPALKRLALSCPRRPAAAPLKAPAHPDRCCWHSPSVVAELLSIPHLQVKLNPKIPAQERCNFLAAGTAPCASLHPRRIGKPESVHHRPSLSPPSWPSPSLSAHKLVLLKLKSASCKQRLPPPLHDSFPRFPFLPPVGPLLSSAIPPPTAEKGFPLTSCTGKGIKW